ncbi:MAG: TonB-dependent receptor [Dysgonamonadaceae bacterium]|nr:TonB-dependent receptor [Dysgonamonadaceae bacterium]
MFLDRTFCVGALLLLQTIVLAQNELDTLQVLEEVVVVANRYREVIPAQHLSGEKLESLSSFSVADAVRYFSGVQIKDYGGIGGLKTVDIRSMGTNHLGVFYDGIQLGAAQNGQIDLGKFSLDNIEEISLYNGQKSEIFQSAKDFGSAGTIYLRTRRPRFTADKKFNINSYFRTGSFDLVNPSVLWEQKITKNISSSFNAEYIYSSGKYPFRYRKVLPGGAVAWDTTAIRQNGDIHSFRVEGGLNGYTTNSNGYWQGKMYFYNSEKGIPGAIVNNVWKRSQRQWDRNFFAQFTVKNILPLPKNYEMLFNLKYANDWMRYLNPDTTLMYLDNTFLQQEIYASLANKYSILQNWDINLSVDYQYNTLNSNLTNFVFPTRNTLLTALATAFEIWRFKAQASLLGTFVFENVRKENAEQSADKTEYTPAVFLSYQPLKRENLNIRAFYKRIFRMPTFNDLYYTDIGNIKLNSEYANQYNLGFQYDKNFKKGIVNHLNVHADAYYNEVTDKIVAIPKGNGQYRWMMMNLGYVEIRGMDVSAQIEWKLPSDIRINTSLNYAFQKAQEFTDLQSPWYGGQIAYIPWHNGSAIVNAQWRTWDLNYSFIYVGERYHNSVNIRENYEQPWYTHDLTLGKSFHFKKSPLEGFRRGLKISAEINNILNQYYDVVLNYPMPGRNFKIILKLDI